MRNFILIPDRISTKKNTHDRFEVLEKTKNNKVFEAKKPWEGDIVGWPSFYMINMKKSLKCGI